MTHWLSLQSGAIGAAGLRPAPAVPGVSRAPVPGTGLARTATLARGPELTCKIARHLAVVQVQSGAVSKLNKHPQLVFAYIFYLNWKTLFAFNYQV